MNFSSARSERITAIVSVVVAVAILAGGVTAYQSHNASVDDVVQLESDFRFQLEVGFRHDQKERARRLAKLEAVTKAWYESPQSAEDRTKLADWLLEATIRSMPGSVEALPALPKFGADTPQPKTDEEPLPAFDTEADDIDPTAADGEFQPTAKLPMPTKQPTTVELPPRVEVASTPATPSNVVVVAAAPLQPVVANEPPPSPVKQPAVAQRLSKPVATPPAPIRVNLSELAARIAGYNAGLDEVELKLARIEIGDFQSLAVQIRTLEQLMQDYQFVSLYHGTLRPNERRWVAEPRDISTALTKLQRHIDRAQDAAAGDFLGDFDASDNDRLGALRQQLAELTSRVNR